MRIRIFFIAFLVSLPFWWGINVLATTLENTLLWNQILPGTPEVLTADFYGATQRVREKNQQDRIKKAAEELDIKAKAVISVRVSRSGKKQVLFAKNPKESLPIASLTKLMTALVVFDLKETYNFSEKITVSKTAVDQEGKSKYKELKPGEKISLDNLVHIMLIESSNDAAYAISEFIGAEGFVELMNLYTKSLGLSGTRFVNPTGLEPDEPDGPKNISTVEELSEIAEFILTTYPSIFEITTNYSYVLTREDGTLHYFIPAGTNELLREFPEIIGGKTGWGIEARGCLLLILEDKVSEAHIINVILGSEDRFGEMKKLIHWTNEVLVF